MGFVAIIISCCSDSSAAAGMKFHTSGLKVKGSFAQRQKILIFLFRLDYFLNTTSNKVQNSYKKAGPLGDPARLLRVLSSLMVGSYYFPNIRTGVFS